MCNQSHSSLKLAEQKISLCYKSIKNYLNLLRTPIVIVLQYLLNAVQCTKISVKQICVINVISIKREPKTNKIGQPISYNM